MLKTLIGDYPVTKQFRTRTNHFDFAQYQGSVASAFKRVVRTLEFDVAEIIKIVELVEALSKQIPLERLGKPNDIAGMVAFLSSDYASYITGQVFVVDGGMVM